MIGPIRTRLRAQVPALKLVAGGAEFAALNAVPNLSPIAYVMPWVMSGGANNLAAGGFRQRIEETAAVFILHRNLRDDRGEAAADDLDVVVRAVRDALIGWVPMTGWEQIETRSGRVFDMSDGVVAWQELFVSASLLRKI